MQLQLHFGIRIGSPSGRLHSLLNPSRIPSGCLPRPVSKTVKMVSESGSSKRPMCPNCSKPAKICLCTRFRTPCHENSVAVTILQHSLEKNHPLNSTRIASLGLRNLNVVSVSDVNFQSRFVVHLLDPDLNAGSSHLVEKSSNFGIVGNGKRKWDTVEGSISISCGRKSSDFEEISDCQEGKSTIFMDSDDIFSNGTDFCSVTHGGFCKVELEVVQGSLEKDAAEYVSKCSKSGEAISDSKFETLVTNNISEPYLGRVGAVSRSFVDPIVVFTIEKGGAITSFLDRSISQDQFQKQANFDRLLASRVAVNGKGFTVNKFQRKQLGGTDEYEELKEFGINVPPGSVLLFPSENAIGIEAIDFEVKNLIVLDGTWAKAKRMYEENPWLKLLPHLKLDSDKLSLYNEVRHQPKAGCLSTIESIVYALKGLGDDSEKLDGLLEVFKSMIGDQRRCKDERLSKVSVNPSHS